MKRFDGNKYLEHGNVSDEQEQVDVRIKKEADLVAFTYESQAGVQVEVHALDIRAYRHHRQYARMIARIEHPDAVYVRRQLESFGCWSGHALAEQRRYERDFGNALSSYVYYLLSAVRSNRQHIVSSIGKLRKLYISGTVPQILTFFEEDGSSTQGLGLAVILSLVVEEEEDGWQQALVRALDSWDKDLTEAKEKRRAAEEEVAETQSATQCRALTVKGLRCKMTPEKGKDLCKYHKKFSEERIQGMLREAQVTG